MDHCIACGRELSGQGELCPECQAQGHLRPAANEKHGPRISAAGSRVAAWVIPTNEELMIARHAGALLGLSGPRGSDARRSLT